MVDTAGVLGMVGSIGSGGRRAAIATTALALAMSVGAVGGVASSAAPWMSGAAPAECHGLEATIVGTAGDDQIVGSNEADVIVAGGGDDVVKGRGGDDVICDRAGDDVVRGGKGDDVVRGAAGADLVMGGAGADLLRGGQGRDDLRGGTGNDRLNGGKAVDDCAGGPGSNTLVKCENVPNAAPVAANDAAATTEDIQKPLDVLANDTDPDGDSVKVTAVDATGTKGTVTITGGGSGVSYDPRGHFEALGAGVPGADSFSYSVSDGKGGTDTASVAVTITGSDDPPHAVADTTTVAEDSGATPIDVRGNDTDIDGGPKLITQVTQPTHATVAITGGGADLTYEPDADYCNGGAPADNFAYTLNAGSTATVSVTVTCADDETIAVDDTGTVAEDDPATTIDVLGNDTDVDAGPMTIGQVTQPANGSVVITTNGDDLTYEPDPDYCNDPGAEPTDDFTYTLAGGNTATVAVTVTCVNDAAVAVDDSATVLEDDPAGAIDVLANDTDVEGDAITIDSVTQPDHGTVVVIAGGGTSLTYEPDADYCNDGSPTDDFTYTVPGGSTATVEVTVTCVGPSITSISPSPLVPGAPATLTGRGFSPTVATNTVTIGGASATVTAATATTLTVTVPCVASDDTIAVQATVNGTDTSTFVHPLQVPQRALAVGEATIVGNASEVGCNEIASVNGPARYVIAAYNTSTSPTSSSGIQISGDPIGDESPALPAGRGSLDVVQGVDGPLVLEPQESGDAHLKLLKENAEQYLLLREEFGTEGTQRPGVQPDAVATDLPLTRNFRVSNINAANICNSFYVASATRVYAEGKLVIYEDDATPAAFKAATNPVMAAYYDKIGDQFNADMEPIVRNSFGNILRRDAATDNNGVMVAFSTPRLNNSFAGVAGFVISCDQFPNDDASTPAVGGPYTGTGGNGASNFGEYFYLYQPVVNATGYGSGTPDNWYRTVRSTFIHESKHVASMAARVANDAPTFEAPWLEEGTARTAEELWARESVYNLPWKGNTGYGSQATPYNIYCDVRPGFAECDANPRGPVTIMQRHFTSLYTNLFGSNARLLSPFGPTPSDNASYYYATSWSLIRYAIDRYATSDAVFLKALTESTTSGATNLTERAGVSIDQLLGRWALALSVDDYPGLATASDDVKMPTWNFRNIYAGLNQDFPATYTLVYPNQPTNFAFGSFGPVNTATMYGGGVVYYQVSGTQTQPQLLRLLGNNGAPLPATIRLSIVRVE